MIGEKRRRARRMGGEKMGRRPKASPNPEKTRSSYMHQAFEGRERGFLGVKLLLFGKHL
jgi:hypothetical protein